MSLVVFLYFLNCSRLGPIVIIKLGSALEMYKLPISIELVAVLRDHLIRLFYTFATEMTFEVSFFPFFA